MTTQLSINEKYKEGELGGHLMFVPLRTSQGELGYYLISFPI